MPELAVEAGVTSNETGDAPPLWRWLKATAVPLALSAAATWMMPVAYASWSAIMSARTLMLLSFGWHALQAMAAGWSAVRFGGFQLRGAAISGALVLITAFLLLPVAAALALRVASSSTNVEAGTLVGLFVGVLCITPLAAGFGWLGGKLAARPRSAR